MDTAELIKKVRKIEIKTRGLSKHIFSGEYHSAFKGRGMSFSEVRDYAYGDDVRNIDWNVTARTGEPFVKIFEEERELTVMLLVDMSKSSFFGTQSRFKSEVITEIAAVMAFSAINNNDKVGAILFTDKIEKYIPPGKGKQNTLRIIRELINHEVSSDGTDINVALEYLNNVQKKRAIVFVLSDYMTDGYETALTVAARRHDLIGIQVYDEREVRLPNVGLIHVQDAETQQYRLLDTSSTHLRNTYEQWFKDHSERFRQLFGKTGADSLGINTEDDYVKALLQFFKQRGR